MYFAKERKSREIIPAHKAKRWGSYSCPTCKANVFLRSGKHREMHFAHMPRQGKPECEEFHPSNELARNWTITNAVPENLSVEPLRLGIELEPELASRHGPRKWGLRLTVPKSGDVHGQITIDLGAGDNRKISLTKLALASQTYPADLATGEFGARWISPEVKEPYRSVIEHRIPGLDQATGNAFDATRQKIKPQADAFCWGESYYFVWRLENPLHFPAGLVSHALAEHDGWACALAVLPHIADARIQAWLSATFNLPIIRPKREWAISYPPPYAVDDDGSILVHSTASVLLALKSIEPYQQSELCCTSGQSAISTQMSGAVEHFLEISGTDSKAVYLGWDETPMATLIGKPYPAAIAEPAVILEFELHGTRTSAPLHRARCQMLLSDVRLARAHLASIQMCPAINGVLRFQSAGATAESRKTILLSGQAVPGRTDIVSISIELLDRVREILTDRTLDIALDFSVFGCFHSLGSAQPAVIKSAAILGRSLRARVEWLCKASGAFAQHRKPIAALDDETLLRHFARLSVPVGLLVHKRALETELRDQAVGRVTP